MTSPLPLPPNHHDPAQDLVPSGAFYFPIKDFKQTRHLGFLLLPEFTLLAFGSALDPLRIANQLAQKPLYRWTIFSEDGGPVLSSSGVDIAAYQSIDALPKDLNVLVCSGNRGVEAATQDTIAILRRHLRFGGKLGGICTGASTLARVGVLADRTFTLHWENQPGFVETFPDLSPSTRRFEIDGDLWTCGGGVAAAEMMLSIIRADYGRDFAIAVSDMCLNSVDFEPKAAQRSSLARALSTRNPAMIQILNDMHQNIEDPLPLADMAVRAGLSRRQVERHFKQLMGEPPMTIYRNIRLDRARTLFFETDMSVSQIAVACGFGSRSVFTRHYRIRFGAAPSAHRRKSQG